MTVEHLDLSDYLAIPAEVTGGRVRLTSRIDQANPRSTQPPHSEAPTVLPMCYYWGVAIRKKRSISMPPDVDAAIEAAAYAAGTTYSGWLAATARREFTIRGGLAAVGEYERDHGAFTPEELTDAEEWADAAVARSAHSGARRRRHA